MVLYNNMMLKMFTGQFEFTLKGLPVPKKDLMTSHTRSKKFFSSNLIKITSADRFLKADSKIQLGHTVKINISKVRSKHKIYDVIANNKKLVEIAQSSRNNVEK